MKRIKVRFTACQRSNWQLFIVLLPVASQEATTCGVCEFLIYTQPGYTVAVSPDLWIRDVVHCLWGVKDCEHVGQRF